MQKLEDMILAEGLLTQSTLDRAAALSRDRRKPLTAILVDEALVSEASLLRLLARRHGLEFVALEEYTPERQAIRSLPVKLAAHYSILPIRRQGQTLTIATSNPLEVAAVEDIETNLGLTVERVLACRPAILNGIKTHYGTGADTVERILSTNDEAATTNTDVEESHDLEVLAEDATVVRLVNQLFQEAIESRATDIHFEAQRDAVVVRRRIDGVLYDAAIPRNMKRLYAAIVTRIKLMAHLDIVERRLPQDGRTRVTIGSAEYDLRISVVPAIHGEDVVVRILPTSMLFDLEQLGFSPDHRETLEKYVTRPNGIIFVTGPTGSGKSTTLYSCLSRLNTRERKIITIEDPVEYELRGITQTQIRPGIGLTFAQALRSMLRHDPDVMMVGEVRDAETAQIAIQTAMTGHLVLATLHTNDAAGGPARLIDMGIDPFLITSTVLMFMAQRLVRVICPSCKEPYDSEGQTFYRGRGCRACGQSGYRGRVAIAEVILLDAGVQNLILQKASAGSIREYADGRGWKRMVDDGFSKVAQGVTTADEVLKVTSL